MQISLMVRLRYVPRAVPNRGDAHQVCGDLVDWRAACNRAKRDGRMEFVAGDGCSGRGAGCGGRGHRRGRHGEGQRSMRERLEEGRSMLVEWPARRDTRAWIRAEEQPGR